MNNDAKISYIELWKDICFYEIYKDFIPYETYINYLTNKYNTDEEMLLERIEDVKEEAKKRINKHHQIEKDYIPLFKTECEEEKIRTIIKYNRDREELSYEYFDMYPKTKEKIKKLVLSNNN